MTFVILAEATDDVSLQSPSAVGALEGHEAFRNRRDVVDSTIKCAKPKTTLRIAHHSIDKPIVDGTGMFRIGHKVPRSILWVELDEAIIATDEKMTIGYISRKHALISEMGQKYIEELQKYAKNVLK